MHAFEQLFCAVRVRFCCLRLTVYALFEGASCVYPRSHYFFALFVRNKRRPRLLESFVSFRKILERQRYFHHTLLNFYFKRVEQFYHKNKNVNSVEGMDESRKAVAYNQARIFPSHRWKKNIYILTGEISLASEVAVYLVATNRQRILTFWIYRKMNTRRKRRRRISPCYSAKSRKKCDNDIDECDSESVKTEDENTKLPHTLETLPPEVLEMILRMLPLRDVAGSIRIVSR